VRYKYSIHEVFENPDANDKLWRYMTFTKFLSLLERRALFFCRSDKLGDPFEGSYPKNNIKNRPNDAFKPVLSNVFKEIRKFILLNCWNLSACESAALWRLYAKDANGIAVQTTFERLKASFGSEGKPSIHIGKVNYTDFTKESFDERNCFFTPFLHKMKSFEYEHEVRVLLAEYPIYVKDNIELRTAPAVFEIGTFVDVNLDILIENVYVTPTAQEWFRDKVESTIKRFNLNLIPRWTDLHSTPIY
jgi:hypothetical protein